MSLAKEGRDPEMAIFQRRMDSFAAWQRKDISARKLAEVSIGFEASGSVPAGCADV